MTNTQAVDHHLAEILNRYSTDYLEARLEKSQASYITYRGKDLDSIGKASAIGGNVRALVKGARGFVNFNNLDELPDRVELAVKQAQLAGNEESQLTPVKPVVDSLSTKQDRNPVVIPLTAKKQLSDEYNDIISHTPRLQTSFIDY